MWQVVAVLGVALTCFACASSSTRPPSWASQLLGQEPDVVAAVDLVELREDPLLGRAEREASQVLPRSLRLRSRVEQVDLVAAVGPRDTRWFLVLHGRFEKYLRFIEVVQELSGTTLGATLPNGAVELKSNDAETPYLYLLPSAWLVSTAKLPVAEVDVNAMTSRVSMASGSVAEASLGPRALGRLRDRIEKRRGKEVAALEGLNRVSVRLGVRPTRSVMVLAHYDDAARAQRAEQVLRFELTDAAEWAEDQWGHLPFELRLSIERSGSQVTLTVTLKPTEAQARPRRPAKQRQRAVYRSRCRAGERYDLNRKRCVRAR